MEDTYRILEDYRTETCVYLRISCNADSAVGNARKTTIKNVKLKK